MLKLHPEVDKAMQINEGSLERSHQPMALYEVWEYVAPSGAENILGLFI